MGSDGSNARRLRALVALADLELDALPLFEVAEARTADLGVVDEDVSLPVVLSDEAVPLLAVEPLDGSLCHVAATSLGEDGSPQRAEVLADPAALIHVDSPRRNIPASVCLTCTETKRPRPTVHGRPARRSLQARGPRAPTDGRAGREDRWHTAGVRRTASGVP